MDRFVTRQNIERYRRLADKTTDATERLRIIKSMAEEWAYFELELKVRCRGAPWRGIREAVRGPPRGAARC
jgi:hypothetical protein